MIEMDDEMRHLFPSVSELDGKHNVAIVCNHLNFKNGLHVILYEVYKAGKFGFRLHDHTKEFCEDAGMSGEDTLMWVLAFGDKLPRELLVDNGELSLIH